MSRSITLKKSLIGAGLALAVAGTAMAAGGLNFDYKMKHPSWSFQGMFGTYDKAAMQRGFQVYTEVCSACHAVEHLSFRHLGDKGGPYYDANYKNPNDNPYVKTFAADERWVVNAIDEETGDVIERRGITSDKIPRPFPNEFAARASNGGALPPDLSLIVKSRAGGADYLYNLLTAYGQPLPDIPADKFSLGAGQHYNPVMEGGIISMASPLVDDIIEYAPQEVDDGHGIVETIQVEATVDQMARDVSQFLAWASDPKLEQRKSLGLGVMIYLLILTGLLFLTYKRVWRDVEH